MKLLDKIFKYLKKKGGVVWEEKSGVGINLLLIATIPLIFGLGFEGTFLGVVLFGLALVVAIIGFALIYTDRIGK
jgi:hypothetical protein|tara:strand:+ start:595 stop:819 length:225 start_codon:yes stop_codon:yes gene_type:complete